jgi:hypothetical protein
MGLARGLLSPRGPFITWYRIHSFWSEYTIFGLQTFGVQTLVPSTQLLVRVHNLQNFGVQTFGSEYATFGPSTQLTELLEYTTWHRVHNFGPSTQFLVPIQYRVHNLRSSGASNHSGSRAGKQMAVWFQGGGIVRSTTHCRLVPCLAAAMTSRRTQCDGLKQDAIRKSFGRPGSVIPRPLGRCPLVYPGSPEVLPDGSVASILCSPQFAQQTLIGCPVALFDLHGFLVNAIA